MHKGLLLVLSLFLIGAAPKRPVIVSVTQAAPFEIVAGKKVEFPLELKILKGYHIQSNPASEEFLIPVTAKLQGPEGIQIGEPLYPKGVPFRLKSSKKDISTYENSVVIRIPMQVAGTVKPGEIPLKGTIRYQGCDAELCFPPVTLPVELKLKVRN